VHHYAWLQTEFYFLFIVIPLKSIVRQEGIKYDTGIYYISALQNQLYSFKIGQWAAVKAVENWRGYFILFIYLLLFICAYNAWVISPPFSYPFPYPPTLSLSPPFPRYPAETILPLSLILLKRKYKQ
jgi:hypothetical protein